MNSKKKYILTSAICDTLAAVIVLTSFCWFHHVKRMNESNEDEEDGGIIVGGPARDDETKPSAPDKEDTDAPDTNEGDDTSSETDAETDAETDEPDPGPDLSGDFAANFPNEFLAEGEVEKGDDFYRSHDIHLTVSEFTEDFGEYVAKYFIYDVYVRNLENIFTVASTKRTAFTDLVKAAGDPIAAVSGDFWGNVACVTVRNGTVLESKKRLERDICAMYTDGTMEIVGKREYTSDYFDGKDVYQVWDFGPSLLDDNGKAYDDGDFDSYYSAIIGRNPRSSIGYYEPGHYVFIVADGRLDIEHEGETVYSKGLRMRHLADIYERLGVKVAYALDGGDSAFAFYDGEVIRQDYERGNTPGQKPRTIYDIICIGEVTK